MAKVTHFHLLVALAVLISTECHGQDGAAIPPDNECDSSQFRCSDGQCIRASWKCNGDGDCYNGSDETTEVCPHYGAKCENVTGGGFACSNGQCIRASGKCNGLPTCSDGSDATTEVCGTKCENVTGGGFACSDGKCIKASWKCDGAGDCSDGSDETAEVCPHYGAKCENVTGGGFPCSNGQCIKASWICNEHRDCSDGGDETTEVCRTTELNGATFIGCAVGSEVLIGLTLILEVLLSA